MKRLSSAAVTLLLSANLASGQDLPVPGVKFHVCGQVVTGREIDPATILPEIQLDLRALTTLIDLQSQGYVLVGG